MDQFICKHGEVIHGALSCFDRMLFRGYLPIMSCAAMADFLQAKGVHRWSLKTFLLTQAARLKKHAVQMAAATGRPYQYLSERTRKADLARQIAERDGIDDGLVCVFALLEMSRTFSVVWKERNSFVQSTRRKCLQSYYYFMDRELGLIHVKLQTWFPFQMQVYLNGHEWLARKLDRRGVKYLKVDIPRRSQADGQRHQAPRGRFPQALRPGRLTEELVCRTQRSDEGRIYGFGGVRGFVFAGVDGVSPASVGRVQEPASACIALASWVAAGTPGATRISA